GLLTSKLNVVSGKLIRGPGDQILVSGSFKYTNGRFTNGLTRLNLDGSTDTTFNFDVSNPLVENLKVAIRQDESMVVGSAYDLQGAYFPINGLAFLRSNGNYFFTTNFFRNERRNTDIGHLVVDSKDQIYVAEGIAADPLLGGDGRQQFYRYKQVETFEFSTLNLGNLLRNRFSYINGIYLQENDQLMVYGRPSDQMNLQPNMLRLNEDTTIDPNFQAELPEGFLVQQAITTQQDETFVVGNHANTTISNAFGYYKLSTDGNQLLDLSDNFQQKDGSKVSIAIQKELPNGWLIIVGNFDLYNGIEVSNGKIIIDTNGVFIQEFLPAISSNTIDDILVFDDQFIFLSGKFETPDGLKTILKIEGTIPEITSNTKGWTEEVKIHIFPNPVQIQNLNLELPNQYNNQNFDYTIIEIASGRTVQQGEIKAAARNEIALAFQTQGAFLIRLKSGNKNLVGQFIVKLD
ncbi:MAG: delta-60 repeat domain-containing protein, partial [Bacteroidota bacterium]